MKKGLLICFILIVKFSKAQNVGIGTSAPSAKLHVSNGAVLFSGTTGSTPVSGAGTRMMWIPGKAAFRAGVVTGNHWDDANIGISSIAIGSNTIASGNYSTAIGPSTTSTATYATALGYGTSALEENTTAIGYSSEARGYGSTAIGYLVSASGNAAFASGYQTKARSYSGFVAGMFNDTTDTPNPSFPNSQNRIFQIGNGTDENARTNAVTVLQNGNTGIGELYPDVNLVVNKDIRLDGEDANNGAIANSLRFGSAVTTEFIASKRTSGGNQQGLDFYTDGSPRVSITNTGNVGIGTTSPDLNLVVNKDLRIDGQGANNGTIANSLRFGSSSTAEFIASKRTSGGNQYGLDFYTNGTLRLSLTNSGNVQVINNLTVQNGKGIIRSTDGTQKKQLSASVTINTTFAAGETKTFTITWPETFSASPEAYVGNVAGGGGGFAELVMTVAGTSTTGATLYVYNPKTSSTSPNFSVKVVAIGAQ